MDYLRVRKALADFRNEHKLGVPELAELSGINKTTIYYLEDLTDSPESTVHLVTIDKLCDAMGVTLTDFFSRVEGLAVTSGEPRQPSRDDPIEAAVTRVAEALVRRIDERTRLVAPAATVTPSQAPSVADATPQSALAREARDLLGTAKRPPHTKPARSRRVKHGRRERDAAKQKRA